MFNVIPKHHYNYKEADLPPHQSQLLNMIQNRFSKQAATLNQLKD